MARAKLYDLKEDGVLIPTEHCHAIWYLKNIIDEYGEQNAAKIFYYFHCMWSLDPDDNPFANVQEDQKKEIITRNVIPPNIDIDDPLIEEGLELTGVVYDTANVRMHRGFKRVMDKLSYELNFVHISLNKEDGNSGEIKKASDLYKQLKIDCKESYKEMMEELGTTEARGGRTRNKYSGKSEELE